MNSDHSYTCSSEHYLIESLYSIIYMSVYSIIMICQQTTYFIIVYSVNYQFH